MRGALVAVAILSAGCGGHGPRGSEGDHAAIGDAAETTGHERVRVVGDFELLPRVPFAPDDATLTLEGAALLDDLARRTNGHPGIGRLSARGHSDPGERDRAALALRRAEAVRVALIARGLPSSLVVAEAAPDDEIFALPHDLRPEANRVVTFEVVSR